MAAAACKPSANATTGFALAVAGSDFSLRVYARPAVTQALLPALLAPVSPIMLRSLYRVDAASWLHRRVGDAAARAQFAGLAVGKACVSPNGELVALYRPHTALFEVWSLVKGVRVCVLAGKNKDLTHAAFTWSASSLALISCDRGYVR